MTHRTSILRLAAASAWLLGAPLLHAGDATTTGIVITSAPSSRWILAYAPMSGDDNHNGYTLFEIAPAGSGMFSTAPAHWARVTGDSGWRNDVFARGMITPGTAYDVRVTTFDPDGVSGPNPQIAGPIVTPADDDNVVHLRTVKAEVRRDEIHVSAPISGDSNGNSGGTVEIATSLAGPWTRRCGSTSEANLPFAFKHCRLRSLAPGTDYFVRVTLTDPDGVSGENPRVVGPIHYDGLANLALQRPITADPGWGCCPNPSHLVDGRIQHDAWYFGFAWTGGLGGWAGGPAGWKQATVDLGAGTTLNRALLWYHDPAGVPTAWRFQVGDDGTTWTDVYAQTQPVCRTASVSLAGAWYHPACAHEAVFPVVTSRYLRYWFDDRTLFDGIHGWAAELEAYHDPALSPPATDDAASDPNAGRTPD